nr:MAG TPA: hypothetical protein [Caudoviricetes sp.]
MAIQPNFPKKRTMKYFFLYSLSKSFNLQRLRNHFYPGVTVKSFRFNIILL